MVVGLSLAYRGLLRSGRLCDSRLNLFYHVVRSWSRCEVLLRVRQGRKNETVFREVTGFSPWRDLEGRSKRGTSIRHEPLSVCGGRLATSL